jgi:hypothetical protein
MKKATYEQLVKVAVEYANNNNCSYAIAAKLYKVAKGDVLMGARLPGVFQSGRLVRWLKWPMAPANGSCAGPAVG